MSPRTKQPESTAAQSHPHQDQNAHRNIVKAIDDDDDHTNDSASIYDSAEDTSTSPSQSTAVQTMIIGGLTNQKKRHTVTKNQVKQKYNNTKTKVQTNIATIFDQHEEQAATAHTAQLTRLADLVALKASIEAQMSTKLDFLKTTYDIYSRELNDAVDARIGGLSE